MNRFISIILCAFVCIQLQFVHAQDTALFVRSTPAQNPTGNMNMDAIYNRSFLTMGKIPVSLGGYLETNWQHLTTDGVSAGNEFQFRRLSLFIASSISRRIKFLSEIEYEMDPHEVAEGKPLEVSIEYAAVDMEFHPMLNLRSGIILNPIGAFNQNHDGPKWEFSERPMAMTHMLPATWSNAGFGLYGKHYSGKWMFGYETYISGGFDTSIISNDHQKTWLPESRENTARFARISSGEPLYTGKLAFRHATWGELGFSGMYQIYNPYRQLGVVVDAKRSVKAFAIDYNTQLPKLKTSIITEWAWVRIDLPENYSNFYGSKQFGGFMDIIQPIYKGAFLDWNRTTVNLACRIEYVNWNTQPNGVPDNFSKDQLWNIIPAISFRPNPQTVLRLNYRIQQQQELWSDATVRTRGFVFGLSTYF